MNTHSQKFEIRIRFGCFRQAHALSLPTARITEADGEVCEVCVWLADAADEDELDIQSGACLDEGRQVLLFHQPPDETDDGRIGGDTELVTSLGAAREGLRSEPLDVDTVARLGRFAFGVSVVPLVGFYDGVFGPGDVIHVNVAGDGLTFSRGSNVDVDDEGVVIEGELVD